MISENIRPEKQKQQETIRLLLFFCHIVSDRNQKNTPEGEKDMQEANTLNAGELNRDGVVKLLYAVEIQAARDYLEEAKSGDMRPDLKTCTIRPYTDSALFSLSPKSRDEFFKLLDRAAAQHKESRYHGRKPNPLRLTREDAEALTKRHNSGATWQILANERGVSLRTLLREIDKAGKTYGLPDRPRRSYGRKRKSE